MQRFRRMKALQKFAAVYAPSTVISARNATSSIV
jgi:hypothetical protein